MPQASEAHRARWNGPDDRAAIRFLENAGYRLRSDWMWIKPTEAHAPTDREVDAVKFLIDEWDFGGIVGYVPHRYT
jgi:hypothetical protein